MNTIRILILEDDLETVSILIEKLNKLQDELEGKDPASTFSVTVLAEYTQVEEYINNKKNIYDIVLLDRDCKAGGSFHVLDIETIGVDKIISISSTPPYNEETKQRGVKRIVHKDFQNLDQFSNKVISEIEEMIGSQ